MSTYSHPITNNKCADPKSTRLPKGLTESKSTEEPDILAAKSYTITGGIKASFKEGNRKAANADHGEIGGTIRNGHGIPSRVAALHGFMCAFGSRRG